MSNACVRSMSIKNLAPTQNINNEHFYNIYRNYKVISQFSTINNSCLPSKTDIFFMETIFIGSYKTIEEHCTVISP